MRALLLLAALPLFGACDAPLNAGLRIESAGGLRLAVWYPASAATSSYAYSANLTGQVARDAAPAGCDRFPLLLFVHGFNGCSTQSIFLTEELARRGYIVVAPDYRDAQCAGAGGSGPPSVNPAPFQDPARWTDQTYLDRRDDSRRALDWALADPALRAAADPERIGAVGHSLGGYTAAALAGGWASWKDMRLKAALLLSPYVEPYLVNERNLLAGIGVPVMYQGGTLDVGITPVLKRPGGAYDATGRPKYFPELMAAGHFEWTNAVCASAATVSQCLAASRNARMIVDYGRAFLDQHLRSVNQPLLFQGNTQLATYRREVPLTMVSAASLGPELAADGLVSGFALGLTGTRSLMVTDAEGRTRNAQVFFAADQQINLVLPAGLPAGRTRFAVQQNGDNVATGEAAVSAVAPGLFAANGSGSGVAAAQFLRVRPGGARELGLIFDPVTLQAIPISLSGGEVYLILYGTGFRGGAGASARLGGVPVPVLGIAAQPEFAGLDQAALGPLPASLRGVLNIEFTVSGKTANMVTVRLAE